MKKIALMSGLSFALLSSSILIAPAIAQEAAYVRVAALSDLAPADAYFGRFRMSVLGMRNAIDDVSARVAGASPDELSLLYHKLTMVEDAIMDLKDQYPRDTWLPQFGLAIAQAFAKMAIPGAQVHANTNLDWLQSEYGSSDQALYADSLRRSQDYPLAATEIPIEPVIPIATTVAVIAPVAPPVPARPALPSYAIRYWR